MAEVQTRKRPKLLSKQSERGRMREREIKIWTHIAEPPGDGRSILKE